MTIEDGRAGPRMSGNWTGRVGTDDLQWTDINLGQTAVHREWQSEADSEVTGKIERQAVIRERRFLYYVACRSFIIAAMTGCVFICPG